jgi:hypothetical protein
MKGSLGIVVIPGNGVQAKLIAFDIAVKSLHQLVSSSSVTDAQDIKRAVTGALDAMHSLNDQCGKGEWSMSGWSNDDLGLWRAHMAARNVDHHQSATIIHIDHRGNSDSRCYWAISSQSLSQVLGKPATNGANEYARLLDQKPVLDGFKKLLSLVQLAI